MSKPLIDTLIISAGGTDVNYLIGATTKLNEYFNFKTVYGCSAGSIAGLVVALEVNIDERIEEIMESLHGKSMYGSTISNIYRLITKGYFLEESIREKLLHGIMGDKKEITFGELDFNLNIVATEFETGQTVIFNRNSYPKVKIYQAVMASTAIPLIFAPEKIDDKFFHDAALFHYFPHQWSDTERSLGLCMKNQRYSIGTNPSFLNILLSVLRNHLNHLLENIPSEWKKRTLFLEVDDKDSLEQTFTREKILVRYRAGIEMVIRYLSRGEENE